jgi:hypothetical protein
MSLHEPIEIRDVFIIAYIEQLEYLLFHKILSVNHRETIETH